MLRLRIKGLPSINGFGTGDELINVNVYVPEKLTSAEKKKIEELNKSESFTPSESAKKSIFSKFKKMFD